MIVFDLECQPLGHRFEGWFASSEDFAAQLARGMVGCPHCGSSQVTKAPMAPAVPRKSNQRAVAAPVPVAGKALPAEARALMDRLTALQAEAIRESRFVGDRFAEVSRAMHYGEREPETVHGQATIAEARALVEEGIPVLPLPLPIALPPEKLN